MKYINLLIVLSVFFASCEGIDDTFSKDISLGKERYVGKCDNLIIEKGWKRLRLTWDNTVEPARESIKIVWKGLNIVDSVIIDGSSTSFITDTIFEDQNYEFNVYAIDINGKQSLKTTSFGKPYTEKSDLIRLLKVVEEKYFILHDNLILFLQKANREIADVRLSYYENNNDDLVVRNILGTDFENNFLHISNVDFSKEITLYSKMKLSECFDTISFKPYILDINKKTFDPEFLSHFKYKFDQDEVSFDQLKDIEEVYFDEDINTLEDLLYFPNLKKVYLAKNRYMKDKYFRWYKDKTSKLVGTEKTIYALEKLNEINSTTVELYGDHYGLKDELPGILNYHPVSIFSDSDIEYFDDMFNGDGTLNWEVSSNFPLDASASFANLFDKNSFTIWRPISSSYTLRNHEIIIDMKEARDVAGFLFVQPYRSSYKMLMPSSIQVNFSNDLENWEKPFSTFTDIKLNDCMEEQTKVNFIEVISARYIKIIVKDNKYYNNIYSVIGDFMPFK